MKQEVREEVSGVSKAQIAKYLTFYRHSVCSATHLFLGFHFSHTKYEKEIVGLHGKIRVGTVFSKDMDFVTGTLTRVRTMETATLV